MKSIGVCDVDLVEIKRGKEVVQRVLEVLKIGGMRVIEVEVGGVSKGVADIFIMRRETASLCRVNNIIIVNKMNDENEIQEKIRHYFEVMGIIAEKE